MKELIEKELLSLYEKYTKQKAESLDEHGFYDLDNHEYFLEYQIIGVAKYVKSIAYALEDMNLLGLAAKIEINIQKNIDEDNKLYFEEMEALNSEYDFQTKIRQLCIQLFYEDNRYSVDMNKYKKIINNNESILKESGLHEKLIRYIDENKALDKIYSEVKQILSSNYKSELPEISQIDEVFKAQKEDIYRRADKHITKQLEKATQLTSHSR